MVQFFPFIIWPWCFDYVIINVLIVIWIFLTLLLLVCSFSTKTVDMTQQPFGTSTMVYICVNNWNDVNTIFVVS